MPRWFGTDYKNKEEENEEDEELEEELEEEDEDNEDNNNLEEENNEEEDNEENNNKKYNKLNKKKKRKKYNIISNIKRNVKKKLKEFNNILIDPNKPTDYYYNSEYYSGILHYYLIFTSWLRDIVENDSFNYFILFVIVIAGINIGIQTYPELDGNVGLSILDICILIIFSLEAIMKILSEGLRPHIYFTGPDWKWNCFDFTIVFMSLPFWNGLFGGGSLALLRLVRLMRLGKLIKKVPQLQMIVQGLTGGLASIGYIMILLFLVFYLFAIAGVLFFRANDPFHFGSLIKALITCFVCATLDSWSTIMYINIYGCDKYPDIYSTFEHLNKTAPDDLLTCAAPKPQFAFSAAYFIILVVMTALVMLSLFIGAVALSMQESLDELKEIATEKKRQEKIKKQLNKMFQTRAEIHRKNGTSKHLKGRVMSRMTSIKGVKEAQSGSNSGSSSDELPTTNFFQRIQAKYLFSSPELQLIDISKNNNNINNNNDNDINNNNDSSGKNNIQQNLFQPISNNKMEYNNFNRLEKTPSPNLLSNNPSPIPNNNNNNNNYNNNINKLTISPPPTVAAIHQESSLSGFSDSSSTDNKKRKDPKRKKSRLSQGKINPEELLQLTEASFSTESEEALELRRKLRIGVGDISHGLEDEPKTFELFFVRWKMASRTQAKINLLAEHCKWIADHPNFVSFVTWIIILAGLNVGAQTDPRILSLPYVIDILKILDKFILTVFTIECVLKIFGEVPKPWIYFVDNWNKFDFLIVVGSYTPGVGSLLTILRLLRLLRVLKLVKSFPQLVVIVDALMMGMESIGYIGLILFLCFYVFAIIGMMLFRNNDPFNFGSLHMSMFTLFRCSTLDAWADLLYINMYGCDSYPGGTYSSYPELCTQPSPQGIFAVLYFISFVVIGAQILLTLFIGVVTTSMEEAQSKQTREAKIERQLTALKTSLDLSPVQMRMFREVFNTLDLDGGGLIEEDEIKIGLKAIGDLVQGTNIEEEIKKADPNGHGIDLVTFIVIFCNIPSCRNRRVLRKTVKRWLANKRKRGIFFREPRKKLQRKNTKNIWATNAWNFLEGMEKKITKQSSRVSHISYFTSNNSLLPWRSTKTNTSNKIDNNNNNNNNKYDNEIIQEIESMNSNPSTQQRLKKFQASPHSSLPILSSSASIPISSSSTTATTNKHIYTPTPTTPTSISTPTPPPLVKKPSLLTPVIMKRRGSLFRRASTTTLYQTQHEVDTASNIGENVRQKIDDICSTAELPKINSDHNLNRIKSKSSSNGSINNLIDHIDQIESIERKRKTSSSPTFVHDFEEQKK